MKTEKPKTEKSRHSLQNQKMMKKFFLTMVILINTCVLTVFGEDIILTEEKIPTEIKTYISKHFPEYTILKAVEDKDGLKVTYEIKLSEGVDLEFNSDKIITEISGKHKLPDSVIPKNILLYVTTHYPNNFITDWEITNRKHQQIELNNGLELLFSQSGEFLRIDD